MSPRGIPASGKRQTRTTATAASAPVKAQAATETVKERKARLLAELQALEQADGGPVEVTDPEPLPLRRTAVQAKPELEPVALSQYPTLRAIHETLDSARKGGEAEKRKALPKLFMNLLDHFVQAGVSETPEGQQYDGRMTVVTTIPKQVPTASGMVRVNFADAFTGIAEQLGFSRETGRQVTNANGVTKPETIVRAVSDMLVEAGELRFGFTRTGQPKIWSAKAAQEFKAANGKGSKGEPRPTTIRW